MSEFDIRLLGLWLMLSAGHGTQLGFECIKKYRSLEIIYGLSSKVIENDIGANLRKADNLTNLDNKSLEKAEEVLRDCEKRKITVVPYGAENYPMQLKSIKDPPCVLFTVGTPLSVGHNPKIGMVGTRNATDEGKHLASEIAYDLSRSGFTVISGLAKGIDEASHKGALLAGKSTIAVIAGSADYIYPKENTELYNKIKEIGTIVSEYPPGTNPMNYMFHARNRIISAISNGILVVESGLVGGSMITASHAREQCRPVFAVPGFPGRKESVGTNELLKRGAYAVTSAQDIIDDMNPYFDNALILTERKTKTVEINPQNTQYFNPIVDLQIKKEENTEKTNEEINAVEKEPEQNVSEDKKEKHNVKFRFVEWENVNPILSDEEKKAACESVLNDNLDKDRKCIELIGKMNGQCTANDICAELSLPFPSVAIKLQKLIMADLIKEVGGGRYKINENR